jgi:hypothetical protein
VRREKVPLPTFFRNRHFVTINRYRLSEVLLVTICFRSRRYGLKRIGFLSLVRMVQRWKRAVEVLVLIRRIPSVNEHQRVLLHKRIYYVTKNGRREVRPISHSQCSSLLHDYTLRFCEHRIVSTKEEHRKRK